MAAAPQEVEVWARLDASEVRYVDIKLTHTAMYHSVAFFALAERRPHWYVTNMMGGTYLLGALLTCIPFVDNYTNRTARIFAIVVAFAVKQAWLAGQLPRIPYWTVMDAYLFFGLVFFAGFWLIEPLIVWAACGGTLGAIDGPCRMTDRAMGGVYLLLWTLAHLVMLRLGLSGGMARPWRSVIDENYNEHLTVRRPLLQSTKKHQELSSIRDLGI